MATSSPLVSVILPAYNAESTVLGAISSALAGTYENVEVVICDDASSDGTLDVIRTIDDPRVRVLSNARNLGPGPSRDKAIDASNGEWIAFLDADDEWTTTRIAGMLHAGRGHHDVIVFDDIVLCHHTTKGMIPWRRIHGRNAFGARAGGSIDVSPAQWAASTQFVMQPLVSTSALRASGVRHTGRRFQEDTEFFLRLISKGMRLRYLSDPGYRYRISPGSLSSVSRPGARTREVLEEAITLFGDDEAMRSALGRKARYRTFTSLIGAQDFYSAFKVAMNEPSVMLEFCRRIRDMAWYQLSRILHGGVKR